MNNNHQDWLEMAASLARSATVIDEVPVGAIVVKDAEIIATGFNTREISQDPIAHAETIAIRKASKQLNSWRLVGCTLYVTLEPCIMCAGLLQQTRIQAVVFGCADPKGGALASLFQIGNDPRLNHQFDVIGPLDQETYGKQLSTYFQKKRAFKKAQKKQTKP